MSGRPYFAHPRWWLRVQRRVADLLGQRGTVDEIDLEIFFRRLEELDGVAAWWAIGGDA